MVESIVGCKWSMRVLTAIREGVLRPGELQRHCDGISAKVLNERLRKLQRFGVIQRQVYPETPPRVEYAFTDFGRQFVQVIDSVRDLQRDLDTEASLEATHDANPSANQTGSRDANDTEDA